MLNKNIKKYHREKGISQEKLAVKLYVVRQTVSKWENDLSVPDADALIHIAKILDISVSQLLDIEKSDHDNVDLSEELAKLNAQLAPKTKREKLILQANRMKRPEMLRIESSGIFLCPLYFYIGPARGPSKILRL